MQARMKELIAKINEADTAYYKYDTPILSDRDYDQLYDELVRLEKERGITLSGSPTQRVPGALLEGLVPVPHTRPICHNEEHLEGARFCMICGSPPRMAARAVRMRAPVVTRTAAGIAAVTADAPGRTAIRERYAHNKDHGRPRTVRPI